MEFASSPRGRTACCRRLFRPPRAWACATYRSMSRAWRRSSSASQGGICVNRAPYVSAFLGLMLRDLRVLRRELGPFVVRIVMQPLLFLFVFTYVFPHLPAAWLDGRGHHVQRHRCRGAAAFAGVRHYA